MHQPIQTEDEYLLYISELKHEINSYKKELDNVVTQRDEAIRLLTQIHNEKALKEKNVYIKKEL